MKCRNRELARRGHFDPVRRESRRACKLVSTAEEVANVGLLLCAHLVGAVPRMLASVVGAHRFRRAVRRGAVKEENQVFDAVRFDEELTFTAQLTRAKEVGATGR